MTQRRAPLALLVCCVLAVAARSIEARGSPEGWPKQEVTAQFLDDEFLDGAGSSPRLLLHRGDPPVVACIPSKNGITTTRSVFFQLKYPDSDEPRTFYNNTLFNWVDRLPAEQAHALVTGQVPVVRIAVLRNPFERLASGYVQKVLQPKEWDYVKPYLVKKCKISQRISFEMFVRCIASLDPTTIDRHFRPQVNWCGFDRIQYDYLLSTHDIANQMIDVLQGHNYSVGAVPHLNRAMARSKKSDWHDLYTPKLRKLVEEYYAQDFEFLAAVYDKDGPQDFWEDGL